MATNDVVCLPLDRIRLDGDTHGRERLNLEHVQSLIEDLKSGDVMPPVVVFRSADGTLYLADGFHRWHAYKRAGRAAIDAVVKLGELRDARLYAAGANRGGTLRRRVEDTRRCVMLVLRDEEGKDWPANRISKWVGTSVDMVNSVREIAAILRENEEIQRRQAEARGRDVIEAAARAGVGSDEEEGDHDEGERLSLDGVVTPSKKAQPACGRNATKGVKQAGRTASDLSSKDLAALRMKLKRLWRKALRTCSLLGVSPLEELQAHIAESDQGSGQRNGLEKLG